MIKDNRLTEKDIFPRANSGIRVVFFKIKSNEPPSMYSIQIEIELLKL